MEHCCRVVVGTIEWINKSRTEDVVQIDMAQLWEGNGGWGECVACVHIEVGCHNQTLTRAAVCKI